MATIVEQPVDAGTLPYHWAILSIEELFVDPAYQRPLGKLAKEIAEDYRPELVGTITVNERKSGKLALIDGQHRAAGVSGAGVEVIPATVFHGLSQAREALLFADLQSKRRNVTSAQGFRARLVGKDPVAIALADALDRHGWAIEDPQDRTLGKGVRAIKALETIYYRDPKLLDRTLYISKQSWPREPVTEATHGTIMRGLSRFLGQHDQGIDERKLINRLSQLTPADIRLRADMLRRGKGAASAAVYVSDVIESEYLKREK